VDRIPERLGEIERPADNVAYYDDDEGDHAVVYFGEPISSCYVLTQRDHLGNVTSLERERWKRAHPEFCGKMEIAQLVLALQHRRREHRKRELALLSLRPRPSDPSPSPPRSRWTASPKTWARASGYGRWGGHGRRETTTTMTTRVITPSSTSERPIRSGYVLVRCGDLVNVTSLEHERWTRAHPEFCRKVGSGSSPPAQPPGAWQRRSRPPESSTTPV